MPSRNDAMSFVDWFDSYIILHNHVCMYKIAMSALIKLLSPQGEMCITPLLLGAFTWLSTVHTCLQLIQCYNRHVT